MTSHDAYLNAAVDPELNPVLPRIDFRYLSEADMIAAGVEDVAACTDAMEEALALHARGDYRMAGHNGESHGAKVQFPVNPAHEGMPADGPDRRYVAMPAYLGGSFRTMGVKPTPPTSTTVRLACPAPFSCSPSTTQPPAPPWPT